MSHKAVEVLDRELDRESEHPKSRRLAANIAFGVLDRAGFGKKERPIEHEHKHLHVQVQAMSDQELYKDVTDLIDEEVK